MQYADRRDTIEILSPVWVIGSGPSVSLCVPATPSDKLSAKNRTWKGLRAHPHHLLPTRWEVAATSAAYRRSSSSRGAHATSRARLLSHARPADPNARSQPGNLVAPRSPRVRGAPGRLYAKMNRNEYADLVDEITTTSIDVATPIGRCQRRSVRQRWYGSRWPRCARAPPSARGAGSSAASRPYRAPPAASRCPPPGPLQARDIFTVSSFYYLLQPTLIALPSARICIPMK
jgi:hypothetical protein